MKEVFKSKSFWIAAAVSVFFIFIALINSNRVYETRTDILIIPRSDSAIANSEEIIENIGALPYLLSFYEKMVGENENLSDDFIRELPDYKKKAYWNSMARAERDSQSGIVKIIVSDSDQYRAEILGDRAAKNLVALAGFYYDIRKDIDVRIIDGPITKNVFSENIFILFFESFLGGFFIAFFSFFATFYFFPKKGVQKQPFHWSFFEQSKEKFKSADNKIQPFFPEKKQPWVFGKISKADLTKKAAAPDNLPVSEKELWPVQQEKEIKKEAPIIREATPEEVKKRLNDLLSGKLQ